MEKRIRLIFTQDEVEVEEMLNIKGNNYGLGNS